MNLLIITIIMPVNVGNTFFFLFLKNIINSLQLSYSIRHMPCHIDQYALHHISFYIKPNNKKI